MVESIDWNDGADDTPQQPHSGLWRRFWRSLTGQPTTGPVCRPVTVQGDDGEPVYTTVLGDVPLSDEGHAALGEIVRATQRRFADSNSPWSAWLVDRLLDREWLASDLAEASGGVFNTAQVARWLHSQDVPEPFMAMLAAQACDASVIDALRAAEHGVLVDAIIEEHAERLEQLAKCPCGCEGTECGCGLGDCACMGACLVCDRSAEPMTETEQTADERLTQIRDRNRRLLAVPFETHGSDVHGPGCPACELVRAIDDVQWLLKQVGIVATLREEWGYRWGNGDLEQRAEGYDTEADARIGAHHSDTMMRRYVTDWEDVSAKDAGKDGNRD